uniref:Uncharacterized protein n=1 Tax=Anguilla anguilla TaxID=7936 RepID=A0A0E9TJZ5_ANGAN
MEDAVPRRSEPHFVQ